jgi:hypothetical protein
MKKVLFLIQIILLPWVVCGQTFGTLGDYLRINAKANDPLYTTYAAAMARSRLYGDKAYKMDYYSSCRPVTYSSDQAGSMFAIWKVDGVVVMNTGEFFKKPVVEYSFPDMMIMEYEPFRGIHVKETFLVYSSTLAVVDMEIKNTDKVAHELTVYPVLESGNDSLEIRNYNESADGYITYRYESPYRLISSLKTEYPYPTHTRDFFTANQKVYSYGGYPGDISGFYNQIKTDYYSDRRGDNLNMKKEGFVNYIALQLNKRLRPGEITEMRYMRGVQSQSENSDALFSDAKQLKSLFLKTFYEDNLMLFAKIPRIPFKTDAEKLVYIGSYNLARGSMYPASGKTKYNFYSFSRNPIWGWGHGHQVLHESLSMLSYVYLDQLSAEGSQRVYMEQQDTSGLIAYRHGPRGRQDYPQKKMPTISAPFFSWINWEVYKVSKDMQFLKEAYASGSKYVKWLIRNRDTNHDGTFEWGPNGMVENVRDGYNAVFEVSEENSLDVDKKDISDELECLDLTLMVIKEEKSLAQMASALGKTAEAADWQKKAENTVKLVNKRMWDDTTGFYYSVNKKDYSFKFRTRDLKRQEIIGFLALWAEAAPKDRADKLIKTLTDTTRFWRKYGVPTLSAKDPLYSPFVDYCCKWNGPVWLLWDYMVYEGLKNYGYKELAKQLAGKMMLCVTTQLSKNHNFWESFSPDNEVLNCPSNYIWDSIMARVLIDESK